MSSPEPFVPHPCVIPDSIRYVSFPAKSPCSSCSMSALLTSHTKHVSPVHHTHHSSYGQYLKLIPCTFPFFARCPTYPPRLYVACYTLRFSLFGHYSVITSRIVSFNNTLPVEPTRILTIFQRKKAMSERELTACLWELHAPNVRVRRKLERSHAPARGHIIYTHCCTINVQHSCTTSFVCTQISVFDATSEEHDRAHERQQSRRRDHK